MRPTIKHLRDEIVRIASDIARDQHVRLEDLLGTCRIPRVVRARRDAMRAVRARTGCSVSALTNAWGCGADSVRRAFGHVRVSKNAPKTKERPVYDAITIERLVWQHGPDRALEIINGRDPATNADLAAWKKLISRSGT